MPRSWKPEWIKEKDNLLKCSAKAHFVIHHLLWKAFPKDSRMSYAFWNFCQTRNGVLFITAQIYSVIREKYRETRTQFVYTSDMKKKMSDAKLGKKPWNKGTPMTEEAKQHLSVLNTGRNRSETEETRRKRSEMWSGCNNPNYGGFTSEHLDKLKNAAKNRERTACPHCGILVTKQMLARHHRR